MRRIEVSLRHFFHKMQCPGVSCRALLDARGVGCDRETAEILGFLSPLFVFQFHGGWPVVHLSLLLSPRSFARLKIPSPCAPPEARRCCWSFSVASLALPGPRPAASELDSRMFLPFFEKKMKKMKSDELDFFESSSSLFVFFVPAHLFAGCSCSCFVRRQLLASKHTRASLRRPSPAAPLAARKRPTRKSSRR